MAIAWAGESNSAQTQSASGVTILAFSVTANSTGLLFCGVGSDGGSGTTSSVTRNSVGADAEVWDNTGASKHTSGHYWKNPAGGSYSIVVTLGASEDGVAAGACMFTGVDQTTPVGTPAYSSASSGSPSITVGSVGSTDVVIDVAHGVDAGTPTQGADQTLRLSQDGVGGYTSFGMSTQDGTYGGAMTWTGISGEWHQGGVALKAGASDATVTVLAPVAATANAPVPAVAAFAVGEPGQIWSTVEL